MSKMSKKKEPNEHGNKNNATIPPANLEQNPLNETTGQNEIKKIDAPACVHVHSRRHVLADSDGLCVKWVLDAIVEIGILEDDSPKYVESVTFSQEKIKKSESEMTIITIRGGLA